jgi:hypothetical protein
MALSIHVASQAVALFGQLFPTLTPSFGPADAAGNPSFVQVNTTSRESIETEHLLSLAMFVVDTPGLGFSAKRSGAGLRIRFFAK